MSLSNIDTLFTRPPAWDEMLEIIGRYVYTHINEFENNLFHFDLSSVFTSLVLINDAKTHVRDT